MTNSRTLDTTYVAGYDQKSPTDWSEDVAELHALGIGGSSTVVDLGAGTGTFAEAIAPHVQRVVAVDVSEPMVAKMRERGIEAVQAGFLTYEHQGEPPDAVVTRNALHHLPDFWKALALTRIAQMLRPGGVLLLRDLVFSFAASEARSSIKRWLDAAPTDLRTVGDQLSSPSTSGLNTQRSRGCSSRCSSAQGLRSGRGP